jgi:hypothetical protein
MYAEILQAVRTLAISLATPYTTIEHGAMPPNNGLAMYLGPGTIDQRHLDKGGLQSLTVALNGKHEQLSTVIGALSAIHSGLMLMRNYPRGTGWEIVDIETATPPNYLDREASGTQQWLYGSLLRVTFYTKGECI